MSTSSSSSTADETDDKRESEVFEVKKKDILCSNTSHYLIQDFIGEGRFGKVAKCVNLVTSQVVAIKILKSEDRVANRELKMLRVVSVLDPVKKNVVQFLEKFEHKGHTCLAFEMLDRSLLQLLKDRHLKPLSLNEIRPIAKQLLTAFDALKSIGVIHSDLKLDNIMLVNHVDKPFRVKLIDFGVSFTTSEVKHGMEVQPLGYRAPEATLGLPITEAIDMWALGCILTCLSLSDHPFSILCEYEMMRQIVKVLGQPADHLLSAGTNTHKFFKVNRHRNGQKWCLKTQREYQLDSGIAPKKWHKSSKSLDDLIKLHPSREKSALEDQSAFVSLLRCLLDTDHQQRITPNMALRHPFVTMAHLQDEINTSLYVAEALNKMQVCPVDGEGEASSGTLGTSSAGSATAHPCGGITNMRCSSDGAAAAGSVDASVTEGPSVEVRNSWLKTIRKFFSKEK